MRDVLLAATVALGLACAPAAGRSSETGAGTGAVTAAGQTASQAGQAAGASATQASTLSAEEQRLVAAARAAGETELNLSWAEDTLGGNEGATKLGALMNRLYGLDAKINFTPGDLQQITPRTAQEYAAGRPSSIDLFLGSETHVGPLVQRDVPEPYDYTTLSPRITPALVAPNNSAVAVGSRIVGITYNTNLISAAEAPTRLEDVLQPKWKGLVASTLNAIGFDRTSYRPEWTPERMHGFVGRLSDQVGGLIRGGEQERVASGEFNMLVLNTGSQEVHKLRARGAPVAQVIPDDASLVVFHYLGVPRHSLRPNLAKLFIAAVVSEEGQRLLYDIAYYDHHALPGSRTAPELADVRARGGTPLEVDAKFWLDHPDLGPLQDEFVKIMLEKRGR